MAWGRLKLCINIGDIGGFERNFERPTQATLDAKMFEAVCKLGLEGIVSKRIASPYRSGPSKTWIKVKNPKAPAAIRIMGTRLAELK